MPLWRGGTGSAFHGRRSNPSTGAFNAKLARDLDRRGVCGGDANSGSGPAADGGHPWTRRDVADVQPDASDQATVSAGEQSHSDWPLRLPNGYGIPATSHNQLSTVSGVSAAVPELSELSELSELPAVLESRGDSPGWPAVHGAHGRHGSRALQLPAGSRKREVEEGGSSR